MYRIAAILLALFIQLNEGVAQATPQFQTTLYVEDAVGNRDSVIVGFDSAATTGIDPAFGEAYLPSPFDSVLEVRAGTFLGFEFEIGQLSKIIIEPSEPVFPLSTGMGCFNGLRIFIYIWAKHQPVKVTWDKNQILSDVCVRGSLISNHYTDELASPYDWYGFPENVHVCMGESQEMIIDISQQAIVSSQVHAPVSIEKEVEGMGLQTIYGLRFFPSPTFTFWTPCYYVTGNEEVVGTEEDHAVFPNPTADLFSIVLPAGKIAKTILIWNMQGKLVKTFVNPIAENIDITNLAVGMYITTTETVDGIMFSKRIVKI